MDLPLTFLPEGHEQVEEDVDAVLDVHELDRFPELLFALEANPAASPDALQKRADFFLGQLVGHWYFLMMRSKVSSLGPSRLFNSLYFCSCTNTDWPSIHR